MSVARGVHRGGSEQIRGGSHPPRIARRGARPLLPPPSNRPWFLLSFNLDFVLFECFNCLREGILVWLVAKGGGVERSCTPLPPLCSPLYLVLKQNKTYGLRFHHLTVTVNNLMNLQALSRQQKQVHIIIRSCLHNSFLEFLPRETKQIFYNKIMLPPTPTHFIWFELDFDVKFFFTSFTISKWLKSTILGLANV